MNDCEGERVFAARAESPPPSDFRSTESERSARAPGGFAATVFESRCVAAATHHEQLKDGRDHVE